ncbi:MAG: hypothetical protein A3H35_12690 [Betaproteobacteria bacterium RIFCSPLOWO2_02_FULL_62_17]|nr:MAG: hypothetical protein A3H35_12690 [Betaproteobacteria bacterium RIFCSPLOWO2_02_FULL_62_17]
MRQWIAVDLDGTLAKYNGCVDELRIGEPVEPMVARVREWLKRGIEVRIFTARVAEGAWNIDATRRDVTRARREVEDWCERHIGVRLAVTNMKDYGMVELWDDRAVQVVPNTGLRADGGI